MCDCESDWEDDEEEYDVDYESEWEDYEEEFGAYDVDNDFIYDDDDK